VKSVMAPDFLSSGAVLTVVTLQFLLPCVTELQEHSFMHTLSRVRVLVACRCCLLAPVFAQYLPPAMLWYPGL
jgi:hypothetical protein